MAICKDCYPDGPDPWTQKKNYRPAPHPGPRCATHHRSKRRAQREAARALRLLKTYGITLEQYDALYAAQGGVCFICQRATGKSKKLAVDHDHATGYVRGLLCSVCNNTLGHLRDDEKAAYRIYQYLMDGAPAPDVIGWVRPEGSDGTDGTSSRLEVKSNEEG